MVLYRGIGLPFGRSSAGIPAAKTDDALIKDSLAQIVLTGLNERVMRPTFGTAAYSHIFESNNDVLRSLIRTDVSLAIQKFEPRVAVQDVAVERQEDNSVVVTISYVVIATLTAEELALTLNTSG